MAAREASGVKAGRLGTADVIHAEFAAASCIVPPRGPIVYLLRATDSNTGAPVAWLSNLAYPGPGTPLDSMTIAQLS